MSERLTLAAATEGLQGPSLTTEPLTRTDFVRYAGASGDFNPIHHDETFAQKAGNPSVFGHGMFTAGVCSRAVAEWVGVENVRGFSCRFVSRVWPGDVLTVKQSVASADADGVTIDLSVENQTGEVVLQGTATAVLS